MSVCVRKVGGDQKMTTEARRHGGTEARRHGGTEKFRSSAFSVIHEGPDSGPCVS